MIVELRATRITQECATVWCKLSEAHMFSVYMGIPGAFHWEADFAYYDTAFAWANYMARSRGATLFNYVEQEQHEAT